jgi:hypothetical protein
MNKKVPGLKKKAKTSTNLYNHPIGLSEDSLPPKTDAKTRQQKDSELLNILKSGRKRNPGKNTPSLSHHTQDHRESTESSEYISNTDLALTEKFANSTNPAEDIYAHMKKSSGKKKLYSKGLGG